MLTLTVTQFDDVEDDRGKLLIRIVYHIIYVVGCFTSQWSNWSSYNTVLWLHYQIRYASDIGQVSIYVSTK